MNANTKYNKIITELSQENKGLKAINSELLEALEMIIEADRLSPLQTSIFSGHQMNKIKSTITKAKGL